MLSTHLDPVVVVGSTRTKHGHETAFLKAGVAKQTRAKDRSQLDVASTCHEKAIPGRQASVCCCRGRIVACNQPAASQQPASQQCSELAAARFAEPSAAHFAYRTMEGPMEATALQRHHKLAEFQALKTVCSCERVQTAASDTRVL